MSRSLHPFPKTKFCLDSSKLKEFAVDDFKFEENSRKFSKWVENTVRKGEISHHEQFLLFQWCFQRLVMQTHETQGLLGKELIGSESIV